MYGSFPKEIMAELLMYLSDRESFDSLKNLGNVSLKNFRQALAQLGEEMKQQVREGQDDQEMVDLTRSLKKPHQEILDKLKPSQREKLLKGFLN